MASKNFMSFQVYKTIALDSVEIHRGERTGFRLLWKHFLLLEPFLTPYYLWTKGEVYIASCYGCHLHFLLRLSCHHNGKKYGSWTSPHIPVMKQNVDFKQCPPPHLKVCFETWIQAPASPGIFCLIITPTVWVISSPLMLWDFEWQLYISCKPKS